MAKIVVKGFPGKHRVTEDLGYQHSSGRYGKAVEIDGVERIVVRETGSKVWKLNTPVVDVAGLANAARKVGR